MIGSPWFRLAFLAAAGMVLPSRVEAQQPKPSLAGVVTDSAGRVLDGADVELVGARRKVITGADGAFRFADLPATRYWLMVRRIGYYPVQISLTLRGGEARQANVTLAAHPYELPDVVVRAQDQRYQARMRDFLWRSRAAFGGRFLTRDDIARDRSPELGMLVVRYLPFKSLWVMNEPGGWGSNFFERDEDRFGPTRLSVRRRYRPDCPPAVAVNGGPLSVGWAVNDFEPDEIEALEIYREGSDLPIEYSQSGRSACGVVVVWLKSYASPAS
jgi:hypothetical protein